MKVWQFHCSECESTWIALSYRVNLKVQILSHLGNTRCHRQEGLQNLYQLVFSCVHHAPQLYLKMRLRRVRLDVQRQQMAFPGAQEVELIYFWLNCKGLIHYGCMSRVHHYRIDQYRLRQYFDKDEIYLNIDRFSRQRCICTAESIHLNILRREYSQRIRLCLEQAYLRASTLQDRRFLLVLGRTPVEIVQAIISSFIMKVNYQIKQRYFPQNQIFIFQYIYQFVSFICCSPLYQLHCCSLNSN